MNLFRITHISNISHILVYGITRVDSPNHNPNYQPIGDGSVISTRAEIELTDGTALRDYIPFYFGTKSPMLYVNQNGFNSVTAVSPKEIVYLVTSVESILKEKLDFKFTDGHSLDRLTSFFHPTDIDRIESIIDKEAIKAKYWKDSEDLDLKRRKQAEFLVLGDIPPRAIENFYVYNANSKAKLLALGVVEEKIQIKPEEYF